MTYLREDLILNMCKSSSEYRLGLLRVLIPTIVAILGFSLVTIDGALTTSMGIFYSIQILVWLISLASAFFCYHLYVRNAEKVERLLIENFDEVIEFMHSSIDEIKNTKTDHLSKEKLSILIKEMKILKSTANIKFDNYLDRFLDLLDLRDEAEKYYIFTTGSFYIGLMLFIANLFVLPNIIDIIASFS